MKSASLKEKFKQLKSLDISDTIAQLWIIKEYKREHQSHYTLRFVETDDELSARLLNIVKSNLARAKSFEEMQLDSPENEDDQIKGINYEETDYFSIHNKLLSLLPCNSQITGIEELTGAKAYLIVIRDQDKITLSAYKTIPENWKMKKAKGLIPLLFKENRFHNLENDNVFSISSSIDFIYFNEALFVLSKKNFERGLNFREGMKAKASQFYISATAFNILSNIQLLKLKIGDNQRYLRKIAIIENLALYRQPDFMSRLIEVASKHNWPIKFEGGTIIVTDDTIDLILTLLQNKRLVSELTDEIFDVESAKRVDI